MKFLIVLLAVLAGVWLWRRNRDTADEAPRNPPTRPAAGPAAGPSAMVACAHCGLHLPAAEALPGGQGEHYCSLEHRVAGEGRA